MTCGSSLFSPDHLVNDADIGLDDLDDFVRDVFIDVIGDGDCAAVFLLTTHLNGCVDRLKQSFRVDAGEDEACLVQCLGTFRGGADADGGERMRDRGEERGFFWKRAGIGHNTRGVHLQAVVVVESERLMLNHAAVELKPGGFEAFSASRMAGIQDRHVILFRHPVNRGEKAEEVSVVINVFFAMSREEDVFAFFEAEALMDVGSHDLVEVHVQDFGHRRACDIGTFFRQPAVGEVAPGMFGVRQINVADDVDDAAVGLFRQALILAAVSGLHVEDRNMQAFRADHGETAVGVTEHEDGIRFELSHQLVGTRDDVAHGFAEVGADGVQIDFRFVELKIAEKDAVQRVVVILPGMSENDVKILAAFFDYGGQTDDFRTRANDNQKFQFAVVFPGRFVFHESDLFKECIGIGRIIELVDPEYGVKIVRADVRDIVRIPDRHIDKRRFVSVKFKCQSFIHSDFADFDSRMAFDDRESFDFARVVVVASCNAGAGRREGNLPAEIV